MNVFFYDCFVFILMIYFNIYTCLCFCWFLFFMFCWLFFLMSLVFIPQLSRNKENTKFIENSIDKKHKHIKLRIINEIIKHNKSENESFKQTI